MKGRLLTFINQFVSTATDEMSRLAIFIQTGQIGHIVRKY